MLTFARKAGPSSQLIRKEVPREVDLENIQRATVHELKYNLISPPNHALPHDDSPYVIETDACDTQVACVLLSGTRRKNTYDRLVTGPCFKKTRIDTTQIECLEVVGPSCCSVAILKEVDLPPVLTTMLSAGSWTRRAQQSASCWRVRLMKIDFKFQHRPGRKSLVTNASSGLLSEIMVEVDLDKDLPDGYDDHVGAIITDELKEGDTAPHIRKPTITGLLMEQEKDLLC